MVKFIVVVREPGSVEISYFLEFEGPEVPQIGTYLSINRIGDRVVGDDMIVRHVWWRLQHPLPADEEREAVGSTQEIFVECDPALGPYSKPSWRKSLESAKARGIEIEEFQLDRIPLFGSETDE